MDGYLVFEKTLAGDEATRNRTRLVQRNLRMVLVLVDGVSTVAELVAKAGNSQLVYAAIKELQSAGFITLSAERSAAAAASGYKLDEKKPGPEAPKKEFSHFSEFSTFGARKMSTKPRAPNPNALRPTKNNRHEPTETGNGPEAKVSPGPSLDVKPERPVKQPERNVKQEIADLMRDSIEIKQLHESRVEPSVAEVPEEPDNSNDIILTLEPEQNDPVAKPAKRTDSSAKQIEPAANPAKRPDLTKKTTSEPTMANPKTSREKIKVTPVRRGRDERRLSWSIKLLITLGILLVVLVVGALFFPYSVIQPDVESAMTTALGRNVSIGTIEVSYYPNAGITLNQVDIGQDKNRLSIGTIRLKPSPSALLGEKTFTKVELAGLKLTPELMPALRDTVKSLGAHPDISLNSVLLSNVSWTGKNYSLPNMSGDLQYDSRGLGVLNLHSEDGSSFSLRPRAGNDAFDLTVSAHDWPVPSRGDIKLDFVRGSGTLDGDRIDLDTFSLVVFGTGVAKGKLALELAEQSITADSELEFDQINTKKLFGLFKNSMPASGNLKGKLRFRSVGNKFANIFNQSLTEGEFVIAGGEIKGIDVDQLIRGNQRSSKGGTSPFDQIAGNFAINEHGVRLLNTIMTNGALSAEGYIDGKTDNTIQGSFDILLKTSAQSRKVNTAFSGTWKEPVLSRSQ